MEINTHSNDDIYRTEGLLRGQGRPRADLGAGTAPARASLGSRREPKPLGGEVGLGLEVLLKHHQTSAEQQSVIRDSYIGWAELTACCSATGNSRLEL